MAKRDILRCIVCRCKAGINLILRLSVQFYPSLLVGESLGRLCTATSGLKKSWHKPWRQ